MSHIAYHLEAQRRQRIIDKKHAALERLAAKEGEMERTRQEQLERQKSISFEQEQAHAKERDYYLKNTGRYSGKSGQQRANYIDLIKERQQVVNRNDVRHQARELRDHCLYMGPVNEYFMA